MSLHARTYLLTRTSVFDDVTIHTMFTEEPIRASISSSSTETDSDVTVETKMRLAENTGNIYYNVFLCVCVCG